MMKPKHNWKVLKLPSINVLSMLLCPEKIFYSHKNAVMILLFGLMHNKNLNCFKRMELLPLESSLLLSLVSASPEDASGTTNAIKRRKKLSTLTISTKPS